MTPPFCIYPFKALTFTPAGTAKPCCSFKGAIEKDGRPMKLGEHSSDDIWHSSFMNELRDTMSDGVPAKGCELCIWHEGHGIDSIGKSMTNAWTSGFLNSAKLSTPVVDTSPEWIDIHLGNTCNLKCRSCSALHSSAIAADPVHSHWAPAENEVRPWFRNMDILYGDILKDPDRVRVLNLSGGEPLLIKEARELLRRLAISGAAKRIYLCFVTNATSVDDGFCALLASFERVYAVVSLDGLGPVNDYLRFPSKWMQVEAGIHRLQQVHNVDVCVNTVVQSYNMLNLIELLRYCTAKRLSWGYALLESPAQLNSMAMPQAIRSEAARRLRAYLTEGICPESDRLLQLASAWEGNAESTDTEVIDEFMRFTRDLDASREQSFCATFPELRDMLNPLGVS